MTAANDYEVFVDGTGDSAEAETLEDALSAARVLQNEARDGGYDVTTRILVDGQHLITLTRLGARP